MTAFYVLLAVVAALCALPVLLDYLSAPNVDYIGLVEEAKMREWEGQS